MPLTRHILGELHSNRYTAYIHGNDEAINGNSVKYQFKDSRGPKDAFMAARLEHSPELDYQTGNLYDFLMPPNKPIVAG
ncbi:hypothetical protein ACLB1R_00370 [Escherichia coli]